MLGYHTGSMVAVEAARQRPLLVINTHDDCYEQTLRACELLPSAEIVDRPAAGHGFISVDPEPLARVVSGFIGEHERNV